MKKYILTLFALLTLGSCNDDFLEKYPLDTQTEATAFKSYENFKVFSWGFYNVFANNSDYTQGIMGNMGNYRGDFWAGYLSTYSTSEPNPYRKGLNSAPSSGGGWSFGFIRRCNLMLTNIDKSTMNEKDKNHWRSVGYFFRAYNYFELISRFGDVPWVETVISEADQDMIFGPRDPRKTVADKVLENLQFAEKNIKTDGDGKNTINVHVVRALMSRFCLFEGTWRKYHALGDGDIYLDECIRVSEELVKKYPAVAPNWDARNNTDDLSSYQGMILYKEYITSVLLGATSHTERTSSGQYEMPKYMVENYLCANGKPIFSPGQTQYDGDKDMYDEFRNRDHRLLFSVVPPYSMEKGVIGGMNPPSFDYPVSPVYNTAGYYTKAGVNLMEYADLLKQLLPSATSKRLPAFNWSGTMNWLSPNINGPGQAPMGSRSGYYMWQNYNLWEINSNMANLNTADKPIFYIEEVLLNLAEAKHEKGQFTQAVAEVTINKLRPRAGVAPMVVADINSSFDPARDATVDPVLWEIRRERQTELMGMGFGFQDIRRWKKGPWFINRVQIGTYVKPADYIALNGKTGVPGTTPAAWKALQLVDKNFAAKTGEGYLKRFDNPVNVPGFNGGWSDAFYLFPIPLNQITLNPQLVQNPGWN